MASFVSLPPELKNPILEDAEFLDLLHLSKTCCYFRHYLRPSIYRTTLLYWTSQPHKRKEPQILSGPMLALLLRSFLEDPSLAALVETLYLDLSWAMPNASGLSQANLPLVRSMLQRFLPQRSARQRMELPKSDLSLPETWEDAIFHEQSTDAMCALIVAQCTGLQYLKMKLGPQVDTKWFQEIFRHAAATAPGSLTEAVQFNKLNEVSIRTPFDGILLSGVFSSLFYFSQLTTIRASLHKAKSGHSWANKTLEWPLSQRPVANNLTVLQLLESEVTPKSLGVILAATPALVTLEYRTLFPSSSTPISCTALQRALSNVSSTLENLEIWYEAYADEKVDVTSLANLCRGHLNLQNMTALKSLNISFTLLLGHRCTDSTPLLADLLPPSLKQLTINDDFWDYDKCEWADRRSMTVFESFLQGDWRAATPHLEELNLDMAENAHISHDYWLTIGREELRRMVEGEGLKCTILASEP